MIQLLPQQIDKSSRVNRRNRLRIYDWKHLIYFLYFQSLQNNIKISPLFSQSQYKTKKKTNKIIQALLGTIRIQIQQYFLQAKSKLKKPTEKEGKPKRKKQTVPLGAEACREER